MDNRSGLLDVCNKRKKAPGSKCCSIKIKLQIISSEETGVVVKQKKKVSCTATLAASYIIVALRESRRWLRCMGITYQINTKKSNKESK